MHPAGSLIAFTTLSGLGFGLMVWLGLGAGAAGGWAAFAHAAAAVGLASVGLLASLAHLGNPQRAWRALSQWRSSWLSREGVLALATLAAFGLYAALWVFGARPAALGALAAVLAAATVASTAMIYASLRAVPRWRHWATPGLFLLLSLGGGAALAGLAGPAAGLLMAALAVQVIAWTEGDRALARSGADLGTATGLGDRGRVRALEPPHTGRAWLTDEMAFRVARRRSRALRRVAVALGYVVPILLLIAVAEGRSPALMLPAVGLHVAGVMASRWLFYAEAEHVLSLYYGHGPNRPA